MGREKAKKEVTEERRGRGKKRRHSHRSSRSQREDEESESESEDVSSSSSDSDSDSETSSSSTSEEERERRRRKKRREEKKRRRSSEGGRKHSSKAKKEHKKHRTKKKKQQKTKNIEVISMDDYFRKSVEFRTWLSEERKIFFSDLSSEESRSLFKTFVKEWNDRLLHKKYYKGLQSSSLEHGKQTGHVWKFSKSLSRNELSGIKESVSSWTAGGGTTEEVGGASVIGPHPPPPTTTDEVTRRPMIGPSPGPSVALAMHSDPHLAEERRREERERERRGRKDLRKQHELVLDELLPKATGKEARFEKKKIRAEKRRDREISPDVAESTLMGPRTDIHKKIQNRQNQRQRRAEAAAEKVAEIQAKESAKMKALLEMARANKKEGALW